LQSLFKPQEEQQTPQSQPPAELQSQPKPQEQQPPFQPTAESQPQPQSQQPPSQQPPAELQSLFKPQEEQQTPQSQPPAESQSQPKPQEQQPPSQPTAESQPQPQSQSQQPPSQQPPAESQSQSQSQPHFRISVTEADPSIIDLRDSVSDEEVDTEDVEVAADACIPIEILKQEAKTYMALAELYGNFKTAPESVDIDYGGETHTLNSFHYRGNSRVRDVTSTGRASAKKAYIDINDTKEIIYRWEIMGCLTTLMRYKVKIMTTLRLCSLTLIIVLTMPLY
jgi:hypothetical protein